MADKGTTFANHFVSNSLCCPSRATILRGQYSHNTGIFTNGGANGGFQTFHDKGRENSTVATWLRAAGYKTVLLGKYLNAYPGTAGSTYVPPGWTEWYGAVNAYPQFDYTLIENGTLVHYGNAPQDYLQDVIGGKAVDFIKRNAASDDRSPFFIWLASYSPHWPSPYAPRHASRFQGEKAPRTPADAPEMAATPRVSHTPSALDRRRRYRPRTRRRGKAVAVTAQLCATISCIAGTGSR
jgi:N-acetylglucosamine-6-sulfatase